jgi:hypothetical protein
VFTPDGKFVIFHYNERTSWYDICKINIDDKQINYITTLRFNGNQSSPEGYWNPSISYYTNKVYFYSKKYDAENKKFITQICSTNIDGTEFKKLTNDNFWNSHPVAGKVSYYVYE